MSAIEQIESKIFVFTITVSSFLNVIEDDDLHNSFTKELQVYNLRMKELYDALISHEEINPKVPILQQIADLLVKMHDIFMNLHYTDSLLVNEKADLQVESTFLKDEIQEFLQQNTI